MRVAANIFYGFCVLIIFAIIGVLRLNPRSEEFSFILKTTIICGALTAWSFVAAGRLKRGKVLAAVMLVGSLTVLVLIGWARHRSLHVEAATPALGIIRAVLGSYLLLLWVGVALAIREIMTNSGKDREGDEAEKPGQA
jgi:hypothetical protein